MKTTLSQLIQEALDARAFRLKTEAGGFCLADDVEGEQLAVNAFEEALNEMIEAKVTQMLKERA